MKCLVNSTLNNNRPVSVTAAMTRPLAPCAGMWGSRGLMVRESDS